MKNNKVILYIPLYMPGFNETLELAKQQKRVKGKGGKWGGYSPYHIMKNKLCSDIAMIIRAQFRSLLEKRYAFRFIWIRINRRKDPDNICFAKKFVMDGIVESKIMKDDRWRQVGEFKDNFAKGERDGVVVEITEYTDEQENEWKQLLNTQYMDEILANTVHGQ